MNKDDFGLNGDKKKSDWVRIFFANLTKKQMEHLHKAEQELLKAGVSFDTGYDFCAKQRDWEFDWALHGAQVVVKKPTKTAKEEHFKAVMRVKNDLEKHGAKVKIL